jgi:hypothetical protein
MVAHASPQKPPGIVIAGFVLSFFGFILGLPALLGLIFGLVGLPQARRARKGLGLAISAIVISALWLLILLALLIGLGSSDPDSIATAPASQATIEDQGSSDGPLIRVETPDAQLAEEMIAEPVPVGTTCISGPGFPPSNVGGVLREVNVVEKDGDVAQGVGITPDGKTAFVALEYADAFAVVNLDDDQVVD